jgi:hypothetical protein
MYRSRLHASTKGWVHFHLPHLAVLFFHSISLFVSIHVLVVSLVLPCLTLSQPLSSLLRLYWNVSFFALVLSCLACLTCLELSRLSRLSCIVSLVSDVLRCLALPQPRPCFVSTQVLFVSLGLCCLACLTCLELFRLSCVVSLFHFSCACLACLVLSRCLVFLVFAGIDSIARSF